MLGNLTQGRRKVGADRFTVLGRLLTQKPVVLEHFSATFYFSKQVPKGTKVYEKIFRGKLLALGPKS